MVAMTVGSRVLDQHRRTGHTGGRVVSVTSRHHPAGPVQERLPPERPNLLNGVPDGNLVRDGTSSQGYRSRPTGGQLSMINIAAGVVKPCPVRQDGGCSRLAGRAGLSFRREDPSCPRP